MRKSNNELVGINVFQPGSYYFVKPLNNERFALYELTMLQYFLEFTWIQLLDIQKEVDDFDFPHFIIFQDDQDVLSRLNPNGHSKRNENIQLEIPILYGDIIIFSLWSGFSIKTQSLRDFQETGPVDPHPFVTVIGSNLIECSFGNRLVLDFESYQKIVQVNQSLNQNQQEIQKLMQQLRIRHAFMVSCFRIKDTSRNIDKEELLVPLALSLVPFVHNKKIESSHVQVVQDLYLNLVQPYQSQFHFPINNDLKQNSQLKSENTKIYANDNDCPFHFFNMLSDLELKFVSYFFASYLRFTLGSSLPDCFKIQWFEILDTLKIFQPVKVDSQLSSLVQLLYLDPNNIQQNDSIDSVVIQFNNELSQINFVSTDIECDDYLKNIFRMFLKWLEKQTFFIFLQNLQSISNQLAQLSFVCQNSSIIKSIQWNQKCNFFVSDGSRSGKSSLAFSLFFHSIFSKLIDVESQFPFCLMIIQENMKGIQQPLYNQYQFVIQEQYLQFFSHSRAVFEKYEQLKCPTIDIQLEQFVKLCYDLSIANQIDYIFMKSLWKQIGQESRVQMRNLLLFLTQCKNNPDLFPQFSQVINYIKQNFFQNADYVNNQQNIIMSEQNNVFLLLRNCGIASTIKRMSPTNQTVELQENQQILLCFDEFLSALSSRIKDSPSIMSFMPILRKFQQLDSSAQKKLLLEEHLQLYNGQHLRDTVLSRFDKQCDEYLEICQDWTERGIQNNLYLANMPINVTKKRLFLLSNIKKILISKMEIEDKQLFKSCFEDIFCLEEVNKDVNYKEIEQNISLRLYESKILKHTVESQDLSLLLLSGAPNLCYSMHQSNIYHKLKTVLDNRIIDQTMQVSMVTEFLFNLFSYRGAFIIQAREIQCIINNYARVQTETYLQDINKLNCDLQSTSFNLHLAYKLLNYVKSDQLLRMQQLKVDSPLQLNIDILETFMGKQKKFFIFILRDNCKILQLNTDNSMINYMSLGQITNQAMSSRGIKVDSSVHSLVPSASTSNQPAMFQKLTAFPSYYTKQYMQGMDFLSSDKPIMLDICKKLNQSAEALAKEPHCYIFDVALSIQDSALLFQQVFSSLNPYIIITKNEYKLSQQEEVNYSYSRRNYSKLLTSQIINTSGRTYSMNNMFFVNRFIPQLFYSVLWFEVVLKEVSKTQNRQVNEEVRSKILELGLIESFIYSTRCEQTIQLHAGYIDMSHTFQDVNQFDKKVILFLEQQNYLSQPNNQITLIRVMGSSNYNLILQQQIQSAFNLTFKNKSVVVIVKQFYDLIESSYGMISINSLLECFMIQIQKFQMSHNFKKSNGNIHSAHQWVDDVDSITIFSIIRDLTMILRLLCIFQSGSQISQRSILDGASLTFVTKLVTLGKMVQVDNSILCDEKQLEMLRLKQQLNEQQDQISMMKIVVSNQIEEQKYLYGFNELKYCISKFQYLYVNQSLGPSKKKKIIQPTFLSPVKFSQLKQSQQQCNAHDLLGLLEGIVDYNQVHFGHLSLEQIHEYQPKVDQLFHSQDIAANIMNVTQTDKRNDFNQADQIKKDQLLTLVQKAVNYARAFDGGEDKVFFIYGNSEVGAVLDTNDSEKLTKIGDGLLIAINLNISTGISSKLKANLSLLMKIMTKIEGYDAWVIGLEYGQHDFDELYNKFYFDQDLVVNSFQIGIKLSLPVQNKEKIKDVLGKQQNQASVECDKLQLKKYNSFSQILYQPVPLSILFDIIQHAAPRYTFFLELKNYILNIIDESHFAKIQQSKYQSYDYHIKKYLI